MGLILDDLTAKKAARGELPLLDGPMLEQFDALRMADALEQEAARSVEMWGPKAKVSIHLDPADAVRLAAALRRP